MVSQISVYGGPTPLLWDQGKAEHHGEGCGGARLFNSPKLGSRELGSRGRVRREDVLFQGTSPMTHLLQT